MEFVAAVLVGGRSRRMGRDKALVPVEGTPMVERVISVMRAAGASLVVTVGGAPRGRADRHLEDRFPDEGPLGGILTVLDEFPGSTVFVVACDLPWIDTKSVLGVLDAVDESDVAFARTDRVETMFGAWRPSARVAVRGAFDSGERAIRSVLQSLRVIEVATDPTVLRNVNRPEDVGDPGQ